MKKRILFIILTILIAASNSYAIPISSDTPNSTESLGSFTGSFDYSFSSETNAQIIVQLTNTSPDSNGGYLTAFAFNNPGNAVSNAVLTGVPSGNFNIIGDTTLTNSIPASPWGDFDIGAASTSSWLSGGNPTGGIGVNETETFTFNLTGTGLDLLTTQNFIDAFSTGGEYWFGARFRGLDDDGSDKVPGNTTIPEPSTLLLLGTGIAGFIFSRRKL
jgi:hypothetical protein